MGDDQVVARELSADTELVAQWLKERVEPSFHSWHQLPLEVRLKWTTAAQDLFEFVRDWQLTP